MPDFHKSVIYQCYIKSFCDSDNDGMGDLKGVTSKLDYLQNLGADYIWLNPFFPSPQRDNGYDVSDYCAVDPRFGTMQDFEELVEEARKRGIGIMLDMVFNHTSTEHEWFRKALSSDSRYENYYIWRESADDNPPNNWKSKFGGSAWAYVPEKNKWYLHLFDSGQADLNWENPQVIEELGRVIRFWMNKGVKGFRFDVINLISKGSYESDDEGDGHRFYTDGPRVHEFLRTLNKATFGADPAIITVGEMSNTSVENCRLYAGADTEELNMVFSFHHLKADFIGEDKWVLIPFDFQKLKTVLFYWQTEMEKYDAWNALFWCNHDQPRSVSRFGDEKKYPVQSAKMLATVIHCMRGTPYVYQGEEIGMTNAGFTSISQYRDVESINVFRSMRNRRLPEEYIYDVLQARSRDNARTPMQWNSMGGFSTTKPWIDENPNKTEINVADQIYDPDSVLMYYKRLIALRKRYDVIANGDFKPLDEDHPSILAYMRQTKNETLVVINNFYGSETNWKCPVDLSGFSCLLSNYKDVTINDFIRIRPYESIVLYKRSFEL